MQFTDKVNRDGVDFIAAGILLFGAGLTIAIVLHNLKNKAFRITAVGVVLALLFFIWTELAVGIFGTPLMGY